jgi:hypothetical protein
MLFLGGVSDDTRLTATAFLQVLEVLEPDADVRTEQTAAVLLSSPEFLLH